MVVLGDPGAGKTTALARIARDTGAAHFFFGRSDGISAEEGGGWSEPIRCAETLGTQLVRAYGPDIVDWSRFGLDVLIRVERVYGQLTGAEVKTFHAIPRPSDKPLVHVELETAMVENGAVVTGISIHKLWIDPMLALQELFLGPLRRAALKTTGVIVLVLDALDEWDRLDCQIDVLEILQRSALPPNIKIIASARPSYASRLTQETLVIDISDAGEQSQFDDDVAELVDAALHHKGLLLEPKVRTDLIVRSKGNFLFASYLLRALNPNAPAEALAGQPPELEAFYHQELDRLADQLAREGMREAPGPLLSVVCSAREPLEACVAARAADLSEDVASDVLKRMSAFIRAREISGVLRYGPFHRSFSDFVLSGRAGLGITPQSGHQRLADRLAPKDEGGADWESAPDYALRHTMAHVTAGGDAMALARDLVKNPAYLVARLQRLGVEALDEDLRYARQAGYDPPHLGAIVVELALRAQAHRVSGVSAAQTLAVVASAVGARREAADFAKLAPEPLSAVPLWTAGLEASRIAVSGIRSEGEIRAAALTAGVLLTLTRTDEVIEVWNLRERLRIASLGAINGLKIAEAEPDGRYMWVATSSGLDQSKLRLLSLPDGAVIQSLEFDQEITALRTSPDGKHVAVGTETGRVYLIDAASYRIVGRREVGSSIRRLQFAGCYLAALTGNRKVVSWSLPGFALDAVRVLPFRGARPELIDRTDGLAFDAASRCAIVGGVDGTVTELDLADEEGEPKRLASLPGWADHIALLASKDVVAGDSTGLLHFIARDVGRPTISLRVHASPLVLVESHANLGSVVTVAEDGEIGVWRYPTNDLIRETAHGAAVMDLTYSNSGARLMSFGIDGSLIEWTPEGRIRQRAYLNPEVFNYVRVGMDLNTILIEKESVQRQTLADAPETLLSVMTWPKAIQDKCWVLFQSQPMPMSITDDAALAATGSAAGLEIWSFDPPQLRWRFPEELPAGRGALTGDGQLLVSKDKDGTLWLRSLEVETETPRRPVPFGGSLLCAPFFTSEGMRLLTHAAGNIRCLSTETLEIETSWAMTFDMPRFAVVTPDGNTVAVFGTLGQIEFWRRSDGRRLGGFTLRHPASVAAFSPDGRHLAIGDLGGGVQVYRLQAKGVNEHDA
jgi:WD40 repeat protein